MILELYFKNLTQLRHRVETVIRPMLSEEKIRGVLLTFKSQNSYRENIDAARLLMSDMVRLAPPQQQADVGMGRTDGAFGARPSRFEIHAVWSSKVGYARTGRHALNGHPDRETATFVKFQEYVKALRQCTGDAEGSREISTASHDSTVQSAAAPSLTSILVVSGTGKDKKKLDAIETLQRLDTQWRSDRDERHPGVGIPSSVPLVSLGCAFNPHLGGNLDSDSLTLADRSASRRRERHRLRLKLLTRRVRIVWLNFGADVEAAEEGIQYLRQLQKELKLGPAGKYTDGAGGESDDAYGYKTEDNSGGMRDGRCEQVGLRIIGSIFIPSKAWLAKMKFRCWSGCFLGDKNGNYLGSVEGARSVTLKLMEVYKRYGVETLVESSVRTEKELRACIEFLELANDAGNGKTTFTCGQSVRGRKSDDRSGRGNVRDRAETEIRKTRRKKVRQTLK